MSSTQSAWENCIAIGWTNRIVGLYRKFVHILVKSRNVYFSKDKFTEFRKRYLFFGDFDHSVPGRILCYKEKLFRTRIHTWYVSQNVTEEDRAIRCWWQQIDNWNVIFINLLKIVGKLYIRWSNDGTIAIINYWYGWFRNITLFHY